MELKELTERIRLPKEAAEAVLEFKMSDDEYREWKELFYQDMKKFLTKWKERPDRLPWALAFYLRLSAQVYEKYQEKGISDEIFDWTFYDITIWCKECFRKYGIYGLEEVWWLALSVKMKLFRLRRLQFEPIQLKEDMVGRQRTIPAGTEVLNVHIPEGEPLDYHACIESLRMAEEFFGGKKQIFVCDSWLLSPNLKEVLPENSNILRFQRMFEVTKVHYAFPQAEQRIFGDILEDKTSYPEDTSLRRNAKAYILSGKDLGIGIGFIEEKEYEKTKRD